MARQPMMNAQSPRGLDVRLAAVAADSGRLRLNVVPDGAEGTADAAEELPFGNRTMWRFHFDESMARLPVRECVQLLMECRRCLRPGGQILLPGSGARAVHAAMSRWAALVGLAALDVRDAPGGWQKRPESTDATPLVSILIPSSNPRYFFECLDSAIAQTHPHIEIIICDDFEGKEIEAMAKSRDGRAPIEYHRNQTRLRARGNYEKLLSLARGDYIKFLNDDDLLAPDCVAALLRPFLAIPDLSLATSHRQPIDARSLPIGDIPATRPVVADDVIVSGISLANAMIMYGLNIIGEPSTMLLRKRDFAWRAHLDGERPFHFNGEEVRGAVDMAMASRVLVQGNAAFLSSRLSSFRLHSEQAQARDDVVARSITGIRGLQHQWIELGLFRRVHPNYLETRPFPEGEPIDSGLTLRPVLSFPPTGNTPENDLRRWRETKRHPFDFVVPTMSG
jgi:glycosyltransferase involved in cell wall biosynthesis